MSIVHELYETVIGLEVHVQLSTRSKAFCADTNKFGAEPNSQVSPISLAHPGTLPRPNHAHIEAGIKLGLAIGSGFPQQVRFDRKNYFYTDLPKGYQITQQFDPICQGGILPIRIGDQLREIHIHHVHLEEDAGKSIHDLNDHHSLIDLNRAGVPLLEIVTEPDFRSGEEVDAFMTAVRQLVRYLDISDGHMEQGSLRCDVNVSVRKRGSQEFGPRCEIKNLNSMRFARQAIRFEFHRQTSLLEKGQTVTSETRNFHPEDGTTSALRSKEDTPDYRYFPEPDMPPIPITTKQIEKIRSTLPPLPWELYLQLKDEHGLTTETARQLTASLSNARYFLECLKHHAAPQVVANSIIQRLLPQFPSLKECPIQPRQLGDLLHKLSEKKLTAAAAFQEVLPAWIADPELSLEQLIAELGLESSEDNSKLEETLQQLLADHPKELAIYRGGNKKIMGFFMGQAMRRLGKTVDPQIIKALLEKFLQS